MAKPVRMKLKKPRQASCDCAQAKPVVKGELKAHGVDPLIKAANLKRLKRIEGQVRGLARMIEEDRYCPQVLTQIAAVHEALRAVGRELMRNHLRHCINHAANINRRDESPASGLRVVQVNESLVAKARA